MRTDQKLHGAALMSAAEKRARQSGYSVVIRETAVLARAIMPDGSYRVAKEGGHEFCLNFGPGSP